MQVNNRVIWVKSLNMFCIARTSKVNLVSILLVALIACSPKKKDNNTLVSFGTDSLSANGRLLMKPAKFDSALNTIINGDSTYLVFSYGFKSTKAFLSIDNSLIDTLLLTTNAITGFTYLKSVSKRKSDITIEIDHKEHFLHIVKKYLVIELEYDSSSKTLKAEYSNNIPIFY
jgi:hypothetical protein